MDLEGGGGFSSFNKKHVLSDFPSSDPYNQNPYMDMGSPRKKKKTQLHNITPLKDTSNGIDEDLIGHLPDECILEIFSFLPSPRDRCSCAAVSKKWLTLQANMRSSDFKASLIKPLNSNKNNITRCLQGKKANDSRLAAIAVGLFPSGGGLSDLCIRGGLPSHQGITDVGLAIIARACPSLRAISLSNCKKVRNKGIESIAQGCTSLEKLELVNLEFVDDRGLISIARNCPSLSTLNIESCPLIGNASLEAFSRYSSSKLESVSLEKCPLLGEKSVLSLISSLSNLSKFKLVSLGVCGGKVLEEVGKHGRSISCLILENLSCSNTQLGFGLMEAISNCSETLKTLELVRCQGIADEYPSSCRPKLLPRYPSLHSLKLEKCNGIGDSFMELIGPACSRLKHLSLAGLRSVTDRGVITLVKALKNKPKNLLSLDLSGCTHITDLSVLAITESSAGGKLRRLMLEGCEGITDRSLKVIAEQCPGLIDLDVSRCGGISDDGVLTLFTSQQQCLEVLCLAGCKGITDRGLQYLEMMCGSLVGLNLKHCTGVSRGGLDSVRETLWWCDLVC